jgi:hypothetical protein
LLDLYRIIKSFYQWYKREFGLYSPILVKHKVLKRYSLEHAYWVESGTYFGHTTSFLSKISKKIVYSIEPSKALFDRAKEKFKNFKNVNIVNNTSEDCMDSILTNLTGNICFFLDGHWSDGITFKGENECPVLFELKSIEKHIKNFDKITICIDDARCFSKVSSNYDKSYPDINVIIKYAETNNFNFFIEHDIIILTK